jgi:hypothetical protein
LELVSGDDQEVRKYRLKAALFVLVMQHHDRSDAQGMPAGMACRHLALQVLQKSIGKVILIASAPGRLYARLPAVRAVIFNQIFLRIAIQRSPTRVPDANGFFRMNAHDITSLPAPKPFNGIYLMLEPEKVVHINSGSHKSL